MRGRVDAGRVSDVSEEGYMKKCLTSSNSCDILGENKNKEVLRMKLYVAVFMNNNNNI